MPSIGCATGDSVASRAQRRALVASVSCIYGLGSAEAYYDMLVFVEAGNEVDRDDVLRKLVEIRYDRNDFDFHRGPSGVRGDVVEVPGLRRGEGDPHRVVGRQVESICEIDSPARGVRRQIPRLPSTRKHYVTTRTGWPGAPDHPRGARLRLTELRGQDKLVEAQRLEQRALFDLEMLETMGYCTGIENYSRHLTGRRPASRRRP